MWTRPTSIATEEDTVSPLMLLLVVVLLLAVVPAWPYSRGWGYGPSGLLGIILVVLVLAMLF